MRILRLRTIINKFASKTSGCIIVERIEWEMYKIAMKITMQMMLIIIIIKSIISNYN